MAGRDIPSLRLKLDMETTRFPNRPIAQKAPGVHDVLLFAGRPNIFNRKPL
jgi:uncharacterized protein YcgI (DUF1989 family)